MKLNDSCLACGKGRMEPTSLHRRGKIGTRYLRCTACKATGKETVRNLERAILADPVKAVTSGMTCSARTRFYYLDPEERRLLGLDRFHNDLPADGVLPSAEPLSTTK
jgi:hypothetical protein